MERLPEVARRIDRAEKILLGLDFDGTLTPIRSRPEEAVLAGPMRAVLESLQGKPRLTLMIVSGPRRLPMSPLGSDCPSSSTQATTWLEIQGSGMSFVEPTAAALTERLQELTKRAQELLAGIPGVIVEPKGLTTSVHFRNVPAEQWDTVARIVAHVVAIDPDGFVLTTGHRIWEIRPRGSVAQGAGSSLGSETAWRS